MEFSKMSADLQAKMKTIEALAQGDREEAKAHEFYLDLKQSREVCGALAKSNKPCPREPHYKDAEKTVTNGRCALHGGKSTGARTPEGKKASRANLRAKTPVHGLFTDRLLNELTNEEIEFMKWMEESIKETYAIETALEETSLQMLIMEAVKHFRLLNTQPFKETKNGAQIITKYMRLIEVQGWRRRDQNEEKRKGVSVDTMMKLLENLPDDNDSSPQIKRIK